MADEKKSRDKKRKEALKYAAEHLEGSKEFILMAMKFEENEDGSPVDPSDVEIASVISMSSGAAVHWMEVLKQTAIRITEEFPDETSDFLAAKAASSLLSMLKEAVEEVTEEKKKSKIPAFMSFPEPGDEKLH